MFLGDSRFTSPAPATPETNNEEGRRSLFASIASVQLFGERFLDVPRGWKLFTVAVRAELGGTPVPPRFPSR